MAQPVRATEYITPEEYLIREESALEKSEYFNGQIFLMAGGSPNHNEICSNIGTEVRIRVRGTSCRQFGSETKLLVRANGLYTYPDGMIVCGQVQMANDKTQIILNPRVIFEVFSPSTENYDRGEKFRLYRPLSSFQEYILVHQDRPYIEQHLKQDDRSWRTYFIEGVDETLALHTVDLSIPLRQIYEFVDWLDDE
ncbi:MAG: Uma2 family endonuclease [Chloroflexota bacterium]